MTATLDKAPAVVRKRAVSSFEQVELWPSRPHAVELVEDPVPADSAGLEAAVHTSCSSRHIEEVVEHPVRPPRLSRKIVTNSNTARTPAVQPGRHIARFLKVTGAIDGVKPTGVRLDLPARSLSQMLRLWRGSSQSTEFTPVC